MTDPAYSFSRRRLLKGSGLGLLVIGASMAGLAAQPSRRIPLPRDGLRVLSGRQYAILTAVAERLCPRAGPGVPGVPEVDVALLADRLFEQAEEDARDGLKLALEIVESGAFGAVLLERIRPFTQLSPGKQARVLSFFRHSRMPLRRTIYRSFSGLVGSLYYGEPRTWPSIGYPGPPDPEGLRIAYAPQLVDLDALRAMLRERG